MSGHRPATPPASDNNFPLPRHTNSQRFNCRNCGAPLNRFGDCEYCGTMMQARSNSVMELAPDRIMVKVDAPMIGRVITRYYADDHLILEE